MPILNREPGKIKKTFFKKTENLKNETELKKRQKEEKRYMKVIFKKKLYIILYVFKFNFLCGCNRRILRNNANFLIKDIRLNF